MRTSDTPRTRTTARGETATLELWADGTYAIELDGERIATTDDEATATELFEAL